MDSEFDDRFRNDLARLFAWRRDVRRFHTDDVPEDLIERLLDLAHLAPSVGNSQPWRWVRVDDPLRREKVRANFTRCNQAALADHHGERAALYARLKLEGLRTAPVQFAVFCDTQTDQGHRLGQLTMPETLCYSVVTAIITFWLAARAEGLGMGWVSILEPDEVVHDLDVDPQWRFVAYLCIGWPEEEHLDPELERHGWQRRTDIGRTVLRR